MAIAEKRRPTQIATFVVKVIFESVASRFSWPARVLHYRGHRTKCAATSPAGLLGTRSKQANATVLLSLLSMVHQFVKVK
jgi:hypothetical protein